MNRRRGVTPIALLASLLGATAARAAGPPRRVVVLTDSQSSGQREIADELRIQVHREHRDVGFEVVKAADAAARREAGARLREQAAAVVVVLGAAMVDEALPVVPAGAAVLYGDLGEHDRRVVALRQKGIVGVVDRCPLGSLVRLAQRLTPRASSVTWLAPDDTAREPVGAALTAAASELGVRVAGGAGARVLLAPPAALFGQGWSAPGPGAPVVTCSRAALERGAATAAFVSETEEVGEELGEQVNALLDGKAPGDGSVEAAFVLLHAERACAEGATVDATLLGNAVVVGARRTCAPPAPPRPRWWALGLAGALTAAVALGARWRLSRGRPARG